MDRALLVASTFCFLFGFAYTMYALGAGRLRPSRFNFVSILAGFVLQTAFLYVRGQAVGRCPLTNHFEIFVFLAWSMALFYFVIGPAYRLSLLGGFTSPLVFLFHIIAFLAFSDEVRAPVEVTAKAWFELHAAVAMVGYGAFALACAAGVMLLLQERQLKSHQIHSIFYHLPPLADLGGAIRRLLFVGFGLVTVGMGAAILSHRPPPPSPPWLHVGAAAGVWLVYAALLGAILWHRLGPRRVAQLSVGAFMLALGTLWGIRFLGAS